MPRLRAAAWASLFASVLLCTGAMASNPAPLDLVSAAFEKERLPQILIGDGDTTGIKPASRDPIGQMPRHRALHVLRVGDNSDGTRLFQSRKASDHRVQFHSVIGGVRLGTGDLLRCRSASEQARPAPWPGFPRHDPSVNRVTYFTNHLL